MPRLAAIDIGTNTLLLCVADSGPAGLQPLLDRSIIARLGEGLDATRTLRPAAIERSLAALARHLEEARAAGAARVAAVGTAVLREARDAERFLEEAKTRFGLEIEVISGEEEARLAFDAVARGLEEAGQDAPGPLLVLDIGGGSTEFILGEGRAVRFLQSLPVGSVRLTERFLPDDPVRPGQVDLLAGHIRSALAGLPGPPSGELEMVGVAGTHTTLAAMKLGLAAYDARAIRRTRLSAGDLERLVATLEARSVAERRRLAGLEPGRADVILAGAVIAREGLAHYRMASMAVSDRGVRHGVLYRMAEDGKR
jgi:exopolyphosphatase/guanosine-5'-triphosphate,3'-diphosphate pyrophosphatase